MQNQPFSAAVEPYPEDRRGRDAWVLARRGARAPVDLYRPYNYFVELERAASGAVVPVATIFLTNSECRWRCVMCDLWRNTLLEPVPVGAIPEQIRFALSELPGARQLKLYNSGSFFDCRAIPPADYVAIAREARGFERVIIESHPALIDERRLRFRDRLASELEIAMGLETAHPVVLEKLNKGISLAGFESAARLLGGHGIALRVFVLVQPPFLAASEALYWAERSIDFGFDCGAAVVSLLPTRKGNGAMEALARAGLFSTPPLATVERAAEYGVRLGRGRVFADVWDLKQFSRCADCFEARLARLREMNLSQAVPPPIRCMACGE